MKHIQEQKTTRLLPIYKLFPNMITLSGICAGLTSIKYTFLAQWELAVLFIFIASIADTLDGQVARVLRSTSNFGEHLDSLADFLNFGVAPAFLLYVWTLKNIKVFGWMTVMIFVICMVIRLARYNSDLDNLSQEENPEQYKLSGLFFTGLPAPPAALTALVPVILSFQDNNYINYQTFDISFTSVQIAIYTTIVALLTISRIPTFKAKGIKIPKKFAHTVILLFSIVIIFLITHFWTTLLLLVFINIILIPFSIVTYIYLKYYKKS